MNFYLDNFLEDLCAEGGFSEIHFDVICNSCYYGTIAEEYSRVDGVHPEAPFRAVYNRLKELVQNFFCNSTNVFMVECMRMSTAPCIVNAEDPMPAMMI